MNARQALFSDNVAGMVFVSGMTDVAGNRAALVRFDGTLADHQASHGADWLHGLATAADLPVAFGVAADLD